MGERLEASHTIDESAVGSTVWEALGRLTARTRVSTIFDCGANEGQAWAQLRARFPDADIHSFEPNPDTFARLESTLRDDRCSRAVNAAVSDEEGRALLHLTDHSYTDSLIRDDLGTRGAKPVRVVTVDAECERLGLDQVGVIKLDVEGSELRAIEGGRSLFERGGVDFVVCELNFKPRHAEQARASQIIERLWDHGLRLFDLYDVRRPDRQLGLGWCDGLFVRKEIHPAFVGDRAP
ncbi:MAG: FkbM family methyltransferase [Planctomycetota bacterium]